MTVPSVVDAPLGAALLLAVLATAACGPAADSSRDDQPEAASWTLDEVRRVGGFKGELQLSAVVDAPTSAHVAYVRLPADETVYESRGDRVWVVRRDEVDVPEIIEYRIRDPSSSEEGGS